MATDPTTAEKAERLDLFPSEPAPDYRAALERLVDVAEQIENAGPGHEDWGALTNAIALARKVLHGQ